MGHHNLATTLSWCARSLGMEVTDLSRIETGQLR
jgi:hypothetical protein